MTLLSPSSFSKLPIISNFRHLDVYAFHGLNHTPPTHLSLALHVVFFLAIQPFRVLLFALTLTLNGSIILVMLCLCKTLTHLGILSPSSHFILFLSSFSLHYTSLHHSVSHYFPIPKLVPYFLPPSSFVNFDLS